MKPTTYRDEDGKTCTKCGEYKPLDLYYRLRAAVDGRQSWCRACMKSYINQKAAAKVEARKAEMGNNYVPLSQERKRESVNRSRALAGKPPLTPAERLAFNYRLTHEEAQRLLSVTNCQCCGKDITGRGQRHTDHDYETGRVRGVLCPSCNTAIGKLGDSVERLQQAIDYLRRATP